MIRISVFTGFILSYIFYSLIQSTTMLIVVGLLANIALITAVFFARGLYLYSGLLFYFIGLYLFFFQNGASYLSYFHSMAGVLSLFIVLPFLNSLILVGQYDIHLNKLLQYKVSNLGHLYKKATFVSHILGLFLNIATVPIVIQSLRKSLSIFSKGTTNAFYAKVILRAYAFCLMWSPMEIMIIQTLDITGGTYITTAPFLLILVAIFLALSIRDGQKTFSVFEVHLASNINDLSVSKQKIIELFILLLMLVFAVSLLDFWVEKGYLFSLVLLIIPVCFLWAVKLGKLKEYIQHVIPHWKGKVQNLANFFFMFIAAGFFVAMFAQTNMIHILQNVIGEVGSYQLILYALICCFFFVSSLLGFHPLVSIVILAEILQPILIDLHTIPLSIVMIVASLSTVTYSPFHATTSILAAEINVNPYEIGKWNIPFITIIFIVTILFAYSIDLVLRFIVG